MPQPFSTSSAPGAASSVTSDGSGNIIATNPAPSAPVPQALAPDESDISAGSFAALTAGIIYLAPVTIYTPVTITGMRCAFSGAPTGQVDMGIYDSAMANLLGHTGAIAAATGLFSQNLLANLPLNPGQYWLAWLDTVADTVYKAGGAAIGLGPFKRSNASTFTVLPASLAGVVQDVANRVGIMALVSGGYV